MPTIGPTNMPTNFPATSNAPTVTRPVPVNREVDEKSDSERDEDKPVSDSNSLTSSLTALTKLKSGDKEKDKLNLTPDMASKILKLIQQKGDRMEQKHREAASNTDFTSIQTKRPQANVKLKDDSNTDLNIDSKDKRPLLHDILKKPSAGETKAASTFEKLSPTINAEVEYPHPKLFRPRPTSPTAIDDSLLPQPEGNDASNVGASTVQRDESRPTPEMRPQESRPSFLQETPLMNSEKALSLKPTFAAPHAESVFISPYSMNRRKKLQAAKPDASIYPGPLSASSAPVS